MSDTAPILLITPPFTQLNTPYPATAYLKGFFNTLGWPSFQSDLGLEVLLRLFSKAGLTQLFAVADSQKTQEWSSNAMRIYALRHAYISTIDDVIRFLQGKNPTLAHRICQEDFLPEASRFETLQELDWAFGEMGIQDRAKHLATLYLEDLSDFIVEMVDSHFGFSRYAERLGRSARSFDELHSALQQPLSFVEQVLIDQLAQLIQTVQPRYVLLSIPFPGNLLGAFRIGQYVKQNHPELVVIAGGGFPNTELRSLSDARVFDYWDYITLDDGERPLWELLQTLQNPDRQTYKRTFRRVDGQVQYVNNSAWADFKMHEVGCPDYTDLWLEQYVSVLEVVNPMHRLWSDGRWNKLTMAHGCYWGKCTFCDISLDYIRLYEPVAARLLVDRMEMLIAQTGTSGFHFVDEAAPPALMREVALEILRRKLSVTWWTNIRFEKSFTADLCRLLKMSGCIAVSGGLEVASDRLLQLIDKGVTVAQVARVTRNFTEAGILVHSYLMYGYPTQTVQETIDSLEMVRQLFEAGIVQSGFWHQFALTAHAPVGLRPADFNIVPTPNQHGTFANNDLTFTDPTGIDHEQFSFGLRKSLYNFMHGIGFDFPLHEWFDFKIPRTKIHRDFIANALEDAVDSVYKDHQKVVWTGLLPQVQSRQKVKGKNSRNYLQFTYIDKQGNWNVQFSEVEGRFWEGVQTEIQLSQKNYLTLGALRKRFEAEVEAQHPELDFALFWMSKPMQELRNNGLLVL